MIQTALLSVSDKTGILPLAKALHELGVKLISTGGTAKLLVDNNIPVLEVSSLTQFPEMLDGRVKTLHPKVHGGLLARRDVPEHMAALAAHGIDTIDLTEVTAAADTLNYTAAGFTSTAADVVTGFKSGSDSRATALVRHLCLHFKAENLAGL